MRINILARDVFVCRNTPILFGVCRSLKYSKIKKNRNLLERCLKKATTLVTETPSLLLTLSLSPYWSEETSILRWKDVHLCIQQKLTNNHGCLLSTSWLGMLARSNIDVVILTSLRKRWKIFQFHMDSVCDISIFAVLRWNSDFSYVDLYINQLCQASQQNINIDLWKTFKFSKWFCLCVAFYGSQTNTRFTWIQKRWK